MRTTGDKLQQAQCEINAALAKRNRAYQMLQEAEEEIVMAQMKINDIMDKEKKK